MFLISNDDNTHNTELNVNCICLIVSYLSLLHSSVIGRLSTRSTEWLSNPNRKHWLFFLTWVENDHRKWTMTSSVPQTEAFYDYLGKKYLKPSSTNREKLFRMLILSRYFKVIEIDEIVHFVNNYRVLRLSNLNSHINILMLISR